MIPVWTLILVAVGTMLVTFVATMLIVRRCDRNKLAYMLDAYEDGELNFRFVEKTKFNRTLNRIRLIWEMHRQQYEQESWIKLIRVLIHEIMNTVSPIASLSDALVRSVNNPETAAKVDIKLGLETISSSSRDLVKFVESYRMLAGVSRPVRKAVMLSEFMEKVISLTSEQCASFNARCSYIELSEAVMIYADEAQLLQIMVNLVKNALQAGATRIDIVSEIDSMGRTIVKVSNNGRPISAECQEQIFVPFFTTKRDGSGIGLSVSRQIMSQHNGTLDLVKSSPEETVFELVFR